LITDVFGDTYVGFIVGGSSNQITGHYDVGTWTHAVGTYDGTTERLYINGVLSNSFDAAVPGLPQEDASVIGYWPSAVSDFFNGRVDDVRIYNRALTDDEIKRLYVMGR
ncbi:MAG: LamG domain-containing protein, partial [Nitrospirales bacterium]